MGSYRDKFTDLLFRRIARETENRVEDLIVGRPSDGVYRALDTEWQKGYIACLRDMNETFIKETLEEVDKS